MELSIDERIYWMNYTEKIIEKHPCCYENNYLIIKLIRDCGNNSIFVLGFYEKNNNGHNYNPN